MHAPSLRAAIADSIAYLASPEAAASLARDPYWPKWHAPWWHVLALAEAGETAAIPRAAVRALLDASRAFFLDHFPRGMAALPPGKDWFVHVVCHCALGSLSRVALACGVEPEEAIPWSRGWFVRYPLPDGGFNCHEDTFARTPPKSSISSTLPPLEYLLALREHRPLSPDELAVLDRGAAYLLRHRLVCGATTGAVLRTDWLVPDLPRFYEYDALRGLSFLVRWATARRRPLPRPALAVALHALERDFESADPACPPAGRRWHGEHGTRVETAPGVWDWAPPRSFPLLDALNGTPAGRARLAAEWHEARSGLERLAADGLVAD